MKKKSVLFAMAAAFTVLSSAPAFAGQWQMDNVGWWYLEDNNTYPVGGWMTIDGAMYYFNNNGYLLTNTITPDGYTVDENGAWVASIPQIQSGNGNSAYQYNYEQLAGKYQGGAYTIEFSVGSDVDTDEIGDVCVYYQNRCEGYHLPVYICTSVVGWDTSGYEAVYEIRDRGDSMYMMFYKKNGRIYMDYNSEGRNYDVLELVQHYES